MQARELLDLLERVAILRRGELRSSGSRHGLPAVQLDALRFLASCNRHSNTPASVAEFLDTTRGTVSQTLIALQRKGLIEKRLDAADGRVVHCTPTRAGLDVVVDSAREDILSGIVERLNGDAQDILVSALAELAGGIANSRDVTVFGRCPSCRHLRSGARPSCSTTGESLNPSDMARLCRFYRREGVEEPLETAQAS